MTPQPGSGVVRAEATGQAAPAVDRALVDAVRPLLEANGAPGHLDRAAFDAALAVAVEQAVRASGAILGSHTFAQVCRAVRDELVGAGPLQPLLDDPLVTDVLVNGPREVWVERAGRLTRTRVDLGTVQDVRALAVRLAGAGGQRLDDASPTVDARLPDGTRLHAVLPPVAPRCPLLSLRVVRSRAFTLDELVAAGTLAPGVVAVLRALLVARANLLVSGATGSGKTTLLASLLSAVPHDERLVVIEEAEEIAPAHPHVVRLLARRANVDGAGQVELADLVRQALRMRPDRLVLGECRGAEVREVMAALNTGHEGGCATVHANAAADVPARLEALAALAGLGRDAVAAQAASAFDAVLHMRRERDGMRRLAEIAMVDRAPDGALRVAVAVTVDGDRAVPGPAWAALAARVGLRTAAGAA
ncbi:TadA family conjugal transfer-associated ATPase [Cellulomonas soli]|uniref:TadA family conjugal transfer-associated ATPase n=1 Tax=Cellulomonas soli TaxID=931535 RepID=UPI003F85A842